MTTRVSKKRRVFLLIIVSSILLNCSALAVDETSPVQQPLAMPSVAGLFFRIIISLIFILVITYVVMKLLKRQNDLQQRQKSWIRIFDYQGLGANRGIYLLELLNDVYVVGVSEGQINILREVDQNDDFWNDVKDSLEQKQEEILPWGLEKLIKENLGKFKPNNNMRKESSFKKELDDQLGRTNRLYRQMSRGDKDDD